MDLTLKTIPRKPPIYANVEIFLRVVDSRDPDPDHAGLKWQGYDGFVFRTDIPGNSNAGYEYTAGKNPQRDGKTLGALNHEQRMDLFEYLKTL